MHDHGNFGNYRTFATHWLASDRLAERCWFADLRTIVIYLIESEERSTSGIAEGNVILRKKFDLPIAITPGMEFAGIANNEPTLVARVVFDTEGRGVHLKSGLVPLQELEDTRKWYASRGWSADA